MLIRGSFTILRIGDQAHTMLGGGFATFRRLRRGSVGLIHRREVGLTLDNK